MGRDQRERSRERDRDRRRERSSSRDRRDSRRDRDRRRSRSRSRSPRRDRDRSPHNMSGPSGKHDAPRMHDMSEEDRKMMEIMGFAGFETTKGTNDFEVWAVSCVDGKRREDLSDYNEYEKWMSEKAEIQVEEAKAWRADRRRKYEEEQEKLEAEGAKMRGSRNGDRSYGRSRDNRSSSPSRARYSGGGSSRRDDRDRDRGGDRGGDRGDRRDYGRDRDSGYDREKESGGYGRDRDAGYGRDREAGYGRDRDAGYSRDRDYGDRDGYDRERTSYRRSPSPYTRRRSPSPEKYSRYDSPPRRSRY